MIAKALKLNSDWASLQDSDWDIVILGAGVAGAAAAILASRSGFKTLVLDAKPFPREKVCGGCLNQRAQASLQRLGVLEDLKQAGAVPINELHLKIATTSVVWKIPTLLSVRRSTLDSLLINTAIEAGAVFIDCVQGTLDPMANQSFVNGHYRTITLQNLALYKSEHETNGESHLQDNGSSKKSVKGKAVLIADGLTRSSLRLDEGWESKIQAKSRIGVQQFIPSNMFGEQAISPGQLHMIVGEDGYVGLSHTDGDLVDVAGAIDPKSIAREGCITASLDRILSNRIGISIPKNKNPLPGQWLATPALTRSSTKVANNRVFLLGDSIGYVEPFTGEGMSWALASAEAVMPIVSLAISQTGNGAGWDNSLSKRWTDWVQSQQKQKQKTCWWISRQLRRISMAAWTLRICNAIYPVRAALIKKVTS